MNEEVLERVARHDFERSACVADVVEELDSACLVADGRAPDLPGFNHAGLLRSDGGELLPRVTAFFDKRKRSAAVVLDPCAPAGIADRLSALGFSLQPCLSDLMLWDSHARHIYTAPEVYMTLATNATLTEWLRIASIDMPEPLGGQTRVMQVLQFRAPGFSFWFGQYGGIPAGVCALYVRDGLAQVGPVVVLPEFRRKGVGLALVNYLARQARKDGAEVTYLFNEPNGPATGLCEAAGFHILKVDAREVWIRQS
jgi:GNAT superfamily N-acetyltransferase